MAAHARDDGGTSRGDFGVSTRENRQSGSCYFSGAAFFTAVHWDDEEFCLSLLSLLLSPLMANVTSGA